MSRQLLARIFRSRLPVYPALFAFAWVLAGVVESGVAPEAATRVALAAVGSVIGVQGMAWLITRNADLAGLIAAGAVVVVLASDVARLLLAIVLIAAASAAVLVAARVWGLPRIRQEGTPALNLITVVLVLVVCVQGVTNGWAGLVFAGITRHASPPGQGASATANEAGLPDVYVLLLDGYPRADVLDEVFAYDNQPFISALEERGFTVATNSHANYMYTSLTLASAFNGRHISDIDAAAPIVNGTFRPGLDRYVIDYGALLLLLRDAGYTLVANASAWEHASLRSADIFLEGSGLNEFERHAIEDTIVGRVASWARPSLNQDINAQWVEDGLANLATASKLRIAGPRFAFIHVPSPHLPLVFDETGARPDPVFSKESRSAIPVSKEVYSQAFVAQLGYLNTLTLAAIDETDLPPGVAVIVMSDHGSDAGTDYLSGGKSDLRERFATLFASRLPPQLGQVYPDDVSASNVLALLIPAVLDVAVDPVSDRFFVSNADARFDSLQEVLDPWSE